MFWITLLSLIVCAETAFAKPVYKVDRAIDAAEVIVFGEIYDVQMVDVGGAPITDLKTFATKENKYKIRNHIRVVEQLYGTDLPSKDLTIERAIPAYYGKEALRKGLKLFYFLKKDGTPIDGEYEFREDRRSRIMEMLKIKVSTNTNAYAHPVTYHVKVGQWPKPHNEMIQKIVSELVASADCYTIGSQPSAPFVPAEKSNVRCSRFVSYTSDTALKPWKRNTTDYEYRIEYIREQNMKPRIALNIYAWDGKVVRRTSSSSWEFETESESWVRDLIVGYSLK